MRNAGLRVKEYSGWPSRARGSGGYESGRPTSVMVHHTASPPSWDGQKDADYCAVGDEDAPLSNLYIDRSGLVWVLAAGATNTNGSGRDTWGGGVPENSMNSYAIGIEAGNNGTGEVWPSAQQNAYIATVRALCDHYKIANNNVRGHFEWAPDRKVDPAGPSNWASGAASWNMNQFRTDCKSAPPPTPEPTPLTLGAIHNEGDPMFIGEKDGKFWIGNGLGRRVCVDNAEVDFLLEKFRIAGSPLLNFQSGQPVSSRGQVAGVPQMSRMGVNVQP